MSDLFVGILDGFLGENYSKISDAFVAAKYALESGGKRFRFYLSLEAAKAFGNEKDNNARRLAVAVELIHNYSLIHDDLPCMDDDDMRRGRPSCHKAHGEPVALLAGDALSVYAGKIICDSNLPPDKKCAMISVLYDCTLGMIEGQTVDIDGRFSSIDSLLDMYEKKTSLLLTASCVMGCIAAGSDIDKTEAARKYAYNLGIAFQIIDDILDVTSTSEELGKPVGSDAQQNKTTSVTLLGIEKATELAEIYTEDAKHALGAFENAGFLYKLTDMLLSRKK